MKLIQSLQEIHPPRPTAVALGFFDGVHLGHRAVVGAAAAYAKGADGLLPVAFSFSTARHAPQKKAGGRIYPDEQRALLLGEAGARLVVLPPFEAIASMEPREFAGLLCGRLQAKVVCCGADYRFAKGGAAGVRELEELCGEYGAHLEIVKPVTLGGERVSTTLIRQALAAGEVEKAARLLGGCYFIDTVVRTGRQIGRTLGFPTINQPFFYNAALPRFGVYAAFAVVDGKRLPAVANIGVKPTVGEHFAPGAETYILDFNRDLYGQRVRVELCAFLRPEERYDSLEELKGQIARDCEQGRLHCIG